MAPFHGQAMPDDPAMDDPAMMEPAKAAFVAWLADAGDAIIDPGTPLHMVNQVASGQAAPPAEIGGYSIIEGDSADSAAAVLQSHPYVGRGGTLQLNEILAV